MIADLRSQANAAAQDAFHRRNDRWIKTGHWDARLTREYRRLDMLVQMLDELALLENTEEADLAAAHDAGDWRLSVMTGEYVTLPDVPLADAGDRFAGMA